MTQTTRFPLKISIVLTLLCAMLFSFPSPTMAKVKSKKLIINTDNGGQIFVDGKFISANTTELKIEAYRTVTVRVDKPGFISQEKVYMNDDSHEIPKSDYFKLEVDDAYESSFTADIANQDVNITTNMKEEDAWPLIARVITGSFDVIQVTDKATGYMCTAWSVKSFKSATVRTRLIIKTASTTPLVYKAKVVSEICGKAGVSANQDELFQPWPRVLRTYQNLIPDLQSRLGKQ